MRFWRWQGISAVPRGGNDFSCCYFDRANASENGQNIRYRLTNAGMNVKIGGRLRITQEGAHHLGCGFFLCYLFLKGEKERIYGSD